MGPGSVFEKKYFLQYAFRKRLSDFDYDDMNLTMKLLYHFLKNLILV